MRLPSIALASLLLTTVTCIKPPGKDAILLSNVQSLTLRAHRMTSSRRVSPIPQLSCAGPSQKICNLYQPEVMRCTNQGYDYDSEDVQWTCTADLPPEFKLGATDVICEGYRDADDKYVLKGSCGVEYRMLLTEKGEERFGRSHGDGFDWGKKGMSGYQKILSWAGDLIFFGFIAAVAILIFWPLLADCLGLRRNRRAPRTGRGWGWGGGGGGGGGGGYPGPPPPYSPFDTHKSDTRNQSWTPGFWSGALGGAAAGYGMGRRAGTGRPAAQTSRSGGYDPGEGSSRSPQFSSTTASTGFGSTRRR